MINDEIQFKAGYYSYLAGKVTFPPHRDDYTPFDFNTDNPELYRALRLSDWFSLGMVAARMECESSQMTYLPSCESARFARHVWHRDINGGGAEEKPPSGSDIRKHLGAI